ncbi:MAG TPA: endonuclease/exonuclease/phosphatase family protein [Flavobacterium sp.]|jgi:endonuclease/exonuclease/phosphatase family metal-dependent hydrolase
MFKKSYLFLLLLCNIFYAQVKICSWNVENFGKSKSTESIAFIANTLKEFDVVALQEIVAGYGGAQKVAELAAELNRKGAKWDYVVSNPTTGSAYKTERYAFLWKTGKVKLKGKAWLEQTYQLEIDREPFIATFEQAGKSFTVVSFHAITKKMQPETEIKYFKFLPQHYPGLNLIFLGDFNCPQTHSVFNPLKTMGYTAVLKKQKTSLKKKQQQTECLASAFDNIFYPTAKINVANYGVVHFYNKFQTLEAARTVSDHIPVWCSIMLK